VRRRDLAWLFAPAIALWACPSDDPNVGNTSGDPGAEQSSSTGTGGPACGELGETLSDPQCASCAEESCCNELKTCDDNLACGELLTCRASCFDQACADQCAAEFGSGAADWDALDQCLHMGPCQADCPVSMGICDTSLTYGPPECDMCLGDNCCAPLQDCLADANCEACMTTGDGMNCTEDIYFQSAISCFMASCGMVCPE
jgi:hypothetical protein